MVVPGERGADFEFVRQGPPFDVEFGLVHVTMEERLQLSGVA